MGEEKKLTGYPSIDKPWLKYYSEEALDITIPEMSAFEYIKKCNENNMDAYAINFYGNKIKYCEMFSSIEKVKKSLIGLGVHKGDYITFCMPTIPETIYLFYALNQLGAVSNFIDLRMNKERIAKCINETKSKVVISFASVTDKVYSIFKNSAARILINIDVTSSLSTFQRILFRIKNGKTVCYDDNEVLSWNDFIKLGGDLKTLRLKIMIRLIYFMSLLRLYIQEVLLENLKAQYYQTAV